MARNEVLALDVIDYLSAAVPSCNQRLEDILRKGGAVWSVDDQGGGKPGGLLRRQPAETRDALRQVLSVNDRASEHMHRAWIAAFGQHPLPGQAYSESIKALEAVLCGALLPKNPKSTLGLVIKTIEDAPHKVSWALPMGDASGSVVGLLKSLWTSQLDRHGTSDKAVPIEATQFQAEGAVQLTLFLLSWLRAGVLKLDPMAKKP
jgi:hypothetical protein